MRYRVLAALAVLVLASCGGTPAPRWNVNDIGDPAQALVEVEARWRADLKQRGGSSTIHPDGRCYIHLSTSGEPGDISTSHPVLCGPVAHWVGRVEPATPQTPTAHVDGIPQFDATYVPPTAHEGRWDVYQWRHAPADRGDAAGGAKMWPQVPVGQILGLPQPPERDQLWHPTKQPPADMGDGPRRRRAAAPGRR